jgi:hypothetical protein
MTLNRLHIKENHVQYHDVIWCSSRDTVRFRLRRVTYSLQHTSKVDRHVKMMNFGKLQHVSYTNHGGYTDAAYAAASKCNAAWPSYTAPGRTVPRNR